MYVVSTIKKNWWKIILIAFIGPMANFLGHLITPEGLVMDFPLSKLAQTIGEIPVIVTHFIIAFGVLAVIFIQIQEGLPGGKLSKGLRYGITMGSLWLMVVMETSTIAGTPVSKVVMGGIADFIVVLLMCILIAVLTGTHTTSSLPRIPKQVKKRVLAVLIIFLVYLGGRYFAYVILQIESGYAIRPIGTLIWTAAMGFLIGMMYCLLAQGVKGRSALVRSFWFAFILFGANWFLLNIFAPLVFEGPLLAYAGRAILDIVFVMISVFTFEKMIIQHEV